MTLRMARGLSILILALFVSWMGAGRLVSGLARYLLTASLVAVSVACMMAGILWGERILARFERRRSASTRLLLWVFYGVQLAAVLVYVLRVSADPTVPFLLEFGLFLVFCLISHDPRGIWVLLLHSGVMVLLMLFYLDGPREIVVMGYVGLFVYAGTLNHSVDRLNQAGYGRPVPAWQSLLQATMINGVLLVCGTGYMLAFPNERVPVAYRMHERAPVQAPAGLLEVFAAGRTGGDRSGAPEVMAWGMILLLVLATGLMLIMFYFLVRMLNRDRDHEEHEDDETGRAQTVTLSPVERTSRTDRWRPIEGSVRERLIGAFEWFQEMMERRGFSREEQETPRAWLERVQRTSPAAESELNRIADTFENARYNRIPFSRETVEQFRQRLHSVLDQIRPDS